MNTPDFDRMRQLFHWVATSTDVFCPLPERLTSYMKNRNAFEFSDLRYHVDDLGCPFCQDIGELDFGAIQTSPAVPLVASPFDRDASATGPRNAIVQGSPPNHPNADALRQQLITAVNRVTPLVLEGAARIYRLPPDKLQEFWQEAMRETIQRIDDAGFRPNSSWEQYLRWLFRNRCLDALKEIAAVSLDQIRDGWDSHATRLNGERCADAPPDRPLEQREKRQRQRNVIDNVLREFCRAHEPRSTARRRKEVLERTLHGQPPKAIADAMRISTDTVHMDAHRGFNWIADAIRDEDLRGSLFRDTPGGFPPDRH